jgi:glycosyltransferase involved in cell wall biosynthesis
MKKESLISCFLPVYNASRFLANWWQRNGPELTEVDARLIVVDNGSDDGTLNLIKSLNYTNIEIIEHGFNRGLEESFRSAKAVISSKYRIFLPSDDWLARGYLADALTILESDPDVGVVYGKSHMVDFVSGAISERFRPYRPIGSRRESPVSTILFNNYIPDISLYRSCHLDCEPNSWHWFHGGLQSSVLSRSKVFYTGRDQCYSGKSAGQVSKEWARSGRYYSELSLARVGARGVCGYSQSADLLWYLIEANFHTGKSFFELLQTCIESGHPYVKAAIQNSREELVISISSVLADDLISDPVAKRVRRSGRYGSFNDLTMLVKSLSTESRKTLAVELAEKGLGGVVS